MMQNWIFIIKSSASHNPSKIILKYWFAAQEKFLIIISYQKQLCRFFFCDYIFSGFFYEWKGQKNNIYLLK